MSGLKPIRRLAVAGVAVIVAMPVTVHAGDSVEAEEGNRPDSLYATYIAGRLQAGTRLAWRHLTEPDSGEKGGTYGSGTYLGTIYGLDERQEWLWLPEPFLAYFLTRWLGIEIAYDRVTAETLAVDSTSGIEKTDGDLILAGPTISLLVRYLNNTPLTPYAGVGLGFYNGDFEETAAWAHSDWGWAQRDRLMVVDSATGLLLTAGVAWSVDTHWSLDCSVQYLHADPDATFYDFTDGTLDTEQTGHFPADNLALRLGVAYTF